MLQQLFHIILVSVFCILWGTPFLFLCNIKTTRDEIWFRSILSLLAFLFFSGCFFISVVSSWLCLLMPLKFTYLALTSIIPTAYLFVYQRKKIKVFIVYFSSGFSKSLLQIIFPVVCISLLLLLSALKPSHWDTQFYHLQLIRWQNEFGVVPGIANLYPRLGLGSNWFNIISLFYFPIFKTENFTYVNAAMVCWFFLWIFSNWQYHFRKFNSANEHKVLSLFYFAIIIFGFIDWQIFRDAANSTNYDFVVIAFIILIFSCFFEALLINKSETVFSPVIIFFSLSLIAFKFSGIFIGLLILYHLITSKGKFKWILTIIMGILILLPILIKNYINTGYPLFPSTFSINQPDWMFPKEMAERFYNYIILANRYYNYNWSFISSLHQTTFNWIPFWFKGILWQHKAIILLAISSSIFLIANTGLSIDQKKLRHLILILLMMIAGWFFTAPDPGRFGYGVLLTAAFLFTSLIAYRFFKKEFFNPILIIAIISLCIYSYKKIDPLIKHPEHFINPIPSDQPAYDLINANGMETHLPEIINNNWDHRCFYTPLPCITQKSPYLQPRGNTIKDGFRMYPHPDSSFISNYEY